MDLQDFTGIIRATMDEVAFGNDGSVAAKAEEQLKTFLDENTSITDDQKAQIYANFLQQIVTTTINQAIGAALQLPVNQKQIDVMERETAIKEAQGEKELELKSVQIDVMRGELAVKEAIKDSDIAVNEQKIASMRAEDEARKNDVAARVARAKVEIEQLIPSQVALNRKDVEIRDVQLRIEEENLVLRQKDVELREKELEIESQKIPLIAAQTLVEQKRATLMDAQVQIENRKIDLTEAQVEIERSKISLVEAQAGVERVRAELIAAQVKELEERLKLITAQTDTEYWNMIMKKQQADTMARSIDVNREIERCKCDTQLKIAQIRAETL